MIKRLSTNATKKEILLDNLEDAETRLYELTHFPGYEETDEFLELSNEIEKLKEEIQQSDK